VPPDHRVDDAGKQSLAYRLTDVVVRRAVRPLAAERVGRRIAYPAMRCAGLLGRLAGAGHPVRQRDRVDGGRSLPGRGAARLGAGHRGVQDRPDARQLLLDRLAATAPWLTLGTGRALAAVSHDAVDAVVCALVAGAVRLGRNHPAGGRSALARR